MSLHRYTVHKAKEAIAARPKPTLRSRAAFFKPSPLCYLNLNGPWNNVTIKKKEINERNFNNVKTDARQYKLC